MRSTRRQLLMGIAALPLATGPALAQQAFTDEVIARLEAQGFVVESMRRTWLGRVQIVSRRGRLTRETVLDPRNGVILRDYLYDDDDDDEEGEEEEGEEGEEENEDEGDDDEDDDEDDEDGDDDGEGGGHDDPDDDEEGGGNEDNSGPGDNSGSGGGDDDDDSD